MTAESKFQWITSRLRQKPVLAGVGAVVLILIAIALISSSRPAAQAGNFFEVRKGDFLITIVEGGTLEAVSEQVIRSEVEGTARIVYIVPEGTYVKKGDLLVELDSSASQDAVNQQQINVEKAQFAVIQAEQQLEIQKSTVDSETNAANLKVEFAKTDLDKYIKGEAEQLRRNAQIEITNVIESLQIAIERLEWTEKLYAKGYETKSNLDKDRLTVSQSKLKLEQAQKELWMLETFDEPKKRRELEAAWNEAKEDLARVILQGERKLAQYKADLETQKSTLELSKRKLERDQKQLQATKAYAPTDGLVVYPTGGGRFSSESMIEEGAVVRFRQELIKLPDISEMKLQVKIHESHINQVRLGQPSYIVIDAMPDQRFRGIVNKIAPLPDSQSRFANPNLKVYATEILVQDKLPDVKPGVSARAEIIITNLQQVLTVPIQAVTTRKGQSVVFRAGGTPTPVPVSVGMYNNKFIEITRGIAPGDRVLLSPPFDAEDKDLGGAIMAQGETPPAVTNAPTAPASRPREMNGRREMDQTQMGPGSGRRERFEGVSSREPDARNPEARGEFAGPRGEGMSEGRRGRPDGEAGGGGGSGRPRLNPEEMLKMFDANKDGTLDEAERAAARERFGRGRRGPGGTNASAETPIRRPDDTL